MLFHSILLFLLLVFFFSTYIFFIRFLSSFNAYQLVVFSSYKLAWMTRFIILAFDFLFKLFFKIRHAVFRLKIWNPQLRELQTICWSSFGYIRYVHRFSRCSIFVFEYWERLCLISGLWKLQVFTTPKVLFNYFEFVCMTCMLTFYERYLQV